MSDLSKVKNEFTSFVERLLGYVPPEAQPTVQAAANDVHAAIGEAETAGESALIGIASAEAPTLEAAITSAVPAEFKGLASLALQLGVAELTSRVQAAGSTAAAA